MKKALIVSALTLLVAAPSFARYIVVLKDGTSYAAKAKWTVVNGKAIVHLENGSSVQLDPALIDVARSEQMTKIGMVNANVLDLDPNKNPPPPKKQQPSLGSQIRLRQPPANAPAATPSTGASAAAGAAAPPVTTGSGSLPSDVLNKFELAYENVGIFDRVVKSTGARSIRAELTIDTEDRVFNAISATSFLMVRNAGVDGVQIDLVELFMKTTNGGAAGRFQMTRADAEALDKRTVSQHEYFVRNVLY